MRARRTVLLGAVVLAGCGDIIGLDGYTGDDASIVDATGSDAAGDVVGQDVKNDVTPVDAGSDVVEAGCAGPEFACVPPLPSGWAWAVYNPDARPACATGYVSPTDVEEGIDASAATCGCTCTTTDPSCTTNKLTITAGSNVACNNVTNGTSNSGAGCNTTNFTTAAGSSISVTGPTPSGGSCTPVPKETLPEAGVDHQGRTCTTDAGGAPGCSGGDICMPNPRLRSIRGNLRLTSRRPILPRRVPEQPSRGHHAHRHAKLLDVWLRVRRGGVQTGTGDLLHEPSWLFAGSSGRAGRWSVHSSDRSEVPRVHLRSDLDCIVRRVGGQPRWRRGVRRRDDRLLPVMLKL